MPEHVCVGRWTIHNGIHPTDTRREEHPHQRRCYRAIEGVGEHALEPPPEQEGEGLDQEERNEERPEDQQDPQGELCP